MTDSTVEPADLGVTAASFMALGADLAVATAAQAESLGYRSFWTAETTSLEAFSLLGAIRGRVPSLDLGTGVLALQLRTPMVVAMAGATLQSLQPERRVLLGVGISSPVVTERWHSTPWGERPIARVREYVELVHECLTGERVDFAGDFYQVKGFRLGIRLGELRPKVVLGALNERMLRLAGEVADGVLLNYLPASHVGWSVEQVRKGEAAAGRPPGSCRVFAYVHVGVCRRDDALEPARRDLFSYAVVDSYARNFERAGFGDEVAEIRERFAARDRAGAVAAVSERMVDAIDVAGDADVVRDTMRAYLAAGVDEAIVMPLPWGPDRAGIVAETVRAAAEI
jgi:probable F420-dependent oxidoreductase